MNQLILSTQKLISHRRERVEDIRLIRQNTNDIIVYVRQGRELISYRYVASTETWSHYGSEPVFGRQGRYPLDSYPWLIASNLLNDKDVIILRHPDGVRFYQPNGLKGLNLLKRDNHFHEVASYELSWGTFYPDTDDIGVMARNNRGVGFYVIGPDSLWANTTYPLIPLGTKPPVSPIWSAPDTELFVTRLLHNNPASIGLRTAHGLEFFRFNEHYLLEKILNTSQITRSTSGSSSQDHLMFGDLTHQIYQDILHLNASGLYLFQYNDPQQDYGFLHRDSSILPSYSPIRLIDVNGDGRDDLVFTGRHGLTALSFDTTASTWKYLLDPEQLSGAQRYAQVVGILPAMPPAIVEPSIFTQDTEGNLLWAKVIPALIPTTPAPSISAQSTSSPTRQATPRNTLFPVQIPRRALLEKPPLRWSEQWDDRFLKNAMDPASGQVRLNIPLIDLFPSTGWNLQIALSYSSQYTKSDLLGIGWSLPIAQDYIFVDYQGSIFPKDAHYYLVAQGQSQRLKAFTVDEKGLQGFELADAAGDMQMTISYHQSEQRWIIENEAEQMTYGKANHNVAQDALQRSLGWPNWRGIGRDTAQLKPLIAAWYLNMRLDKVSGRTLYYHYENDKATVESGKTYDAALRLKTISDGRDMTLDFDYGLKESSEFTPPNPVDKSGNIIFPAPLDQSHYIKGYRISTDTISQKLQFTYEVNDSERLLTVIQQPLSSEHTERVLQFSYQTILDRPVLRGCSSQPKGLTVQFDYKTIDTKELTLVYNYRIRERAKTAHASDYSVMAYRDLDPIAGKVIVRILNQSMTQTMIDCSTSTGLSCPSAESEIKDYEIQAYRDSFIVFIESNESRTLYVFNRQEKTWSKNPTVHRFGKQALLRFSETVIVAAEPNENNIMLYTRLDNQSGWNEQTLSLTRPITALAWHNGLIAVYDDSQIWLFRHDRLAGWKQQLLDSKPNDISRIMNLFDVEDETKQQTVTAFTQNSLQILNNFILFNTLEENNGRLFSLTHLFLLDSQYNLTAKRAFKIEREIIHEIMYEYDNGDNVFKIGYDTSEGRFKAQVKSISGKYIEDLISHSTNKNEREDIRKGNDPKVVEVIKEINEAKGMRGFLRKALFINPNLYAAQISQLGAYVGNDTLLRFTGVDWEKDHTAQTTPLGKHFILESSDDGNKSLLRLYEQSSSGNIQGHPIEELQLHAPSQSINRYPAYIAYQQTPNLVKVLTFKDEKTLDRTHSFSDEQLLIGSGFENLMTVRNASNERVHSEPLELRVRPVPTLLPPKAQSFVSQVLLTADGIQRITSYERSYDDDQGAQTYNETITMIPGGNKTKYGWREATRSFQRGTVTKTERWFDAHGRDVPATNDQSTDRAVNPNANTTTSNPMLLLDRNSKWLISDFSPYSLADQMVAYYGFEPYEKTEIGYSIANSKATTNSWHTYKAQIVKNRFAFTGQHYLQLENNSTDNPSFFEGLFQPSDQDTTYLVACWIRCNGPLSLQAVVPHLKAIMLTSNGQKVIGLQAKVKHQLGDWSYLELPLNFQVLRNIYGAYFDYHNTTSSSLPPPETAKFQIKVRVEAPAGQIVDLDHIRFAPITHDFQAAIYHPTIGKPTAVIQSNGLVTRTIYNRLHQEIATIDEEGQLQELSSSSRTGVLVPTPQHSKIDAKANTITFEPEYGSYESFDRDAWQTRWILDDPDAFQVAPGQLWHNQSMAHKIEARDHLFDGTSAAIRCYFSLQAFRSALSLNWQEIGSLKLTRQSDHSANVVLPNGQSIATLPSAGEFIVMLEQNYLWLWLDGVLLVDQGLKISQPQKTRSIIPWSSFTLEAQGSVLVEDCFIMNRPQVTVKYYNKFGEKTQVIQLEDANTAQVNEILYDELGREAITTKTTRIKRSGSQSLLTYRPNFVTNNIPSHSQSVWQVGYLRGEVDQLNPADQGYPYKRTEYEPNPLNQEKTLGLPGPDFSITGIYSTKLSQHADLDFLDNLFPPDQGYRQKVQYISNDSVRISVFDQRSNLVAKYVRVPSFNNLLSTYEYDAEDRLIKILPPLYHEKVDTASKTTTWRPGEDHLSSEEKKWQEALATRFAYDSDGHLIRKITPDGGTTVYLYNAVGQRRFMASLDDNGQSRRTVYFEHGANNQLIATGYIDQPLPLSTLREHLESRYLPYAQQYQRFDYAEGHFDPSLRARVQHYITNNDGQVIVEQLRFDAQQQVVSKRAISAEAESDPLTTVEKQYVNGKLRKLIYPRITVNEQPLSLLHSYNRLGQLVGLGTAHDPMYYASFTYHATGQLASEHYRPGRSHSFIRHYHYNSPGFLERISDPFLTEDITYTSKGYGQAGYGDGMVMQATFNASWPINADGRWFQIRESDLGGDYSAVCFQALKRKGYITDLGQPIKLYVRDVETALPLVCDGSTGRHIAKLLAEKQKPTYYGHRYAYGNHQELVKAKYFTRETETLANPLQPHSFAKISGLTQQQSQHIWQLLADAGYIITDQQRYDPVTALGKRGQSFFRTADLHDDLAALNDKYTLYVEPIERLIISTISQRKTLSIAGFEAKFLDWEVLDSNQLIYNSKKAIATEIGQMLLKKGYLPSQVAHFSHPLNSEFTNILHQYAAFIPNIVRVLSQSFAHGLGTTSFDMESYKIDANGNHHVFHTGFDRYELTYHNDSNQIESIRLGWSIDSELKQVLIMEDQGNLLQAEQFAELNRESRYSMKHDAQGNVVQALHKNIQRIDYHPVSQRTTRIQLTDNRTLVFHYDAQGERVLKRVFDAEGEISTETHYLRDEKGRALIDRQTRYFHGSTEKISTAYLYGPRGLLGFIRKNNFYRVTTDHSGSVRLVMKDNRVVAAYDYLPYGQLLRSYGNDPLAHIVYRYTGQEWDEETGLYNYHARLYDPSIGRFYQIDPKAQYFSPYKYAGNSPLSVIDPDGEFAFLLAACIVFAVGFAYIGGAAVNNRWNPLDWDFTDKNTWIGIVSGAVTGAFLPLGVGASFAFIAGLAGTTVGVSLTAGLAVAGAYLSTAAINRSWDPTRWKWDRPDTWNAIFQGAATGAGIAGGIGIAHKFANGRILFLIASYGTGGGLAYLHGMAANNGNFAFWQWDWSNPGTWSGLVDGFDTGMGWPQNIVEMRRSAGKFSKNPRKYLLSGQNKLKLKSIFNPQHPLYKAATSVFMTYIMGSSANGNFDITQWNLADVSTYEGVLNGLFFGNDITKSLKYIRDAKVKHPSNALMHVPKNKRNYWSRRFSNLLNRIEMSHIGRKYRHLVEEAFVASKLWMSRLGDVSPATRSQVDHFLKKGLDEWESGKSRLPKELHRLLRNEAKLKVQEGELVKWKADSDELRRQREVYPDEDPQQFLICNSRRRKRGVNYSVLGSTMRCGAPNDEENLRIEEFKMDPLGFLREYPISVLSADSKFIKRRLVLDNGGPYSFTLEKSIFGDGGGYYLAPARLDGPKLEGYWLRTSGRAITSDPRAKITIENANSPEAKFIFTAEMQGCTLYVNYDQNTDKLDVYHYYRPNLERIFINEHLGEPISNDGGKFVDESGRNILELIGVDYLVDENYMPIQAKDNVIVIDRPLYKRLDNNQFEEIKSITVPLRDGQIRYDTVDMIEKNREYLNKEEELARNYRYVIRWEDYMGFPENFELLQRFNKHPNRCFATMFLYFDDSNPSSGSSWHVASQKIVYPDNYQPGAEESFAILPMTEARIVDIVTKPSPQETPLLNTAEHNRGEHNDFVPENDFFRPIPELPESKSRDRRSVNASQTYVDDLVIATTTNSMAGNRVSIVRSSQDKVGKKGYENLIIKDIQSDRFDTASSGASGLEFWPASLIEKTGKAFLSILSINWSSNSKEIRDDLARSLPPSEPLVEQQSSITTEIGNALLTHSDPSEPFDPSPTILAMGDQWIKNADTTGLLTWGVLLSRKWTGYRTKPLKVPLYSPETDIKLSILSHEVVDTFLDKVLGHGQACGIEKTVSDLIDDPKLYTHATETVRKELAKGEMKNIAEHLFELVIQKKISKIVSMSSLEHAHKLLTSMKQDLANIQEQFSGQEVSLRTSSQEEEELVDEITKDTNSFTQEMGSIQPLAKNATSRLLNHKEN